MHASARVAGPSLLTYVGDLGSSPTAALVAAAHRAIALDLLDQARDLGCFEKRIVVTDSDELARQISTDVEVASSVGPFRFGHHLAATIASRRLDRPIYFSRGALPLLPAAGLSALAVRLLAGAPLVITNNAFSADLVGWSPGEAIARIDPPPTDNPLARQLERDAGLPLECLPRDATSQFDVDTPTDLLVLAVHPKCGPRTRTYVESLGLDTSRLQAAIAHFTLRGSQVVLAGRVGSAVWSALEAETACRVRVFAEERGMKADGRETDGSVRSLFGMYLETVGPVRAFRDLAQLGDCAFVDSRVLFAHLGLNLSVEDRFLSDLGIYGRITNPVAAAITRAAVEAPIPVVLGGHTLLAGGMYALVDSAWETRDIRSRTDQVSQDSKSAS